MSSAQLTVTQTAVQSIRAIVESDGYKKRFAEMLGKRAPQFIASISNLVGQSEQLAECEPRSIILSAVMAATLDLPIEKSLGYAYVVAYGQTATFQIGYKGLIQLALRTGQYAGMRDAIVNAEAFKGYDEIGEPIIDWSALDETKDPVGYAFAWRMLNGFRKTVYWSREKCLAHGKQFSRSFSKPSSPWTTSRDAMCLKTVIRAALSKYGIMSVEMQRAMTSEDVELEEMADGTIGAKSGALLDAAPSEAPTEDTRTMSQKLADGAGSKKPEPKNVTPPAEASAQKESKQAAPQERSQEAAPAAPPSQAPAAQPESPTPDREGLIARMEEAMLDSRVTENRLMAYAVKIQGMVPEGITAFNELPTASLVKLEPAIKALAPKK